MMAAGATFVMVYRLVQYSNKKMSNFLFQTFGSKYSPLMDQRLALGDQTFLVRIQLLAMSRGDHSAAIAWLMYKFL